MIFNRFLLAIGGMTLSYVVSVLSLDISKSIEKTGRFHFLLKIFVFIHFISSMTSLFVGAFFSFYTKCEKDSAIQESANEYKEKESVLQSQIHSLSEENIILRSQLQHAKSISESVNSEKCRTQGYFNGYSIGFEDCMDVLGLPDEQKASMMKMARTSGIHRIKSRPSIFVDQEAVEIDGILR